MKKVIVVALVLLATGISLNFVFAADPAISNTAEHSFREMPNYVAPNLLFWGFLVSFIVKLVLFMLLKFLVFRTVEPRFVRIFSAVLFAQLATLPVLWFMVNYYSMIKSAPMFEALVVAILVEGIVYRYFARISWKKSFIAAAVCSLGSYSVILMA